MVKYILPVFIVIIVILGCIKKVNIYESFVTGAKGSLSLVISIMPYIVAIMIVIQLFESSGFNRILEGWLSPVLSLMGIPKELTSLIIVRPLSGSGSVAILKNLIDTYGVDSYIARCGATIVGASETIFYVAVVYFSTTKVKKIGAAIPISLFSSFIGVIVACLLCRIM